MFISYVFLGLQTAHVTFPFLAPQMNEMCEMQSRCEKTSLHAHEQDEVVYGWLKLVSRTHRGDHTETQHD